MSEGQCYYPRGLCAWGLAALGAQREPGTMAFWSSEAKATLDEVPSC